MSQTQKSPASAPTDQGFTSNKHQDSYSNKSRPPYANRLREFKTHLDIRVFFGGHDAWSRAQDDLSKGYPALLLPVGERPEERIWRCVRGRSVVCIELDDTGPGFRTSLVRVLAAWGAREVALIAHDHQPVSGVYWGV